MSIQKCLEKNKKIQECILIYLENGSNLEENFQNLLILFHNYNLSNDRSELKLLLHLINGISNNHNREPCFLDKIEKILLIFKQQIQNYFSNKDIFNIFKTNKRILLFLIEENIIKINKYIYNKMKHLDDTKQMHYFEFFQPEIEIFENSKKHIKIEENFKEKRKRGENDNYICQLIQDDLIDEFISYVNKKLYPLNSTIDDSIFETNKFLIGKKPTLIEYAAFFGSIQIFKYLHLNQVQLTSELWPYSIHGDNPEIIHLLEEKNIDVCEKKFENCLIESMKCFHNDITNYVLSNYLQNYDEYSMFIFVNSIKFYNFAFLCDKYIDHSFFFILCSYDYLEFVNLLLKNIDIDVNQTTILKKKIFYDDVLSCILFLYGFNLFIF